MVGFRRIKTKWLITAAMVLAVALAFGIWLHHRAAVAARFAKYAMKLREQALLKVEPQVFVPTSSRPTTQRFAWKSNIVTTVFWIGGQRETDNSLRTQSAWDSNWAQSYGGFDNPDPSARRNYIPVAFIPGQNPFYCALPYNDVADGKFKAEAPLVIPWFKQAYTGPGQSICKDRWVAIRKRNHICYAQWEDSGPFLTDHFQYVFENYRPKPNANHGAGLNVSPAVRDYLGLASTDVTDWQFVEVSDVPPGPWRNYGENNHFVIARRQTEKPFAEQGSANPAATTPAQSTATSPALSARVPPSEMSPAGGKTIDGQVFIVTAGAQAIKLALVQVAAIPRTEIEKHISDVEMRIASERTKADFSATEASEAAQRTKQAIAGGFGEWMRRVAREHPNDHSPEIPRAESQKFHAAEQRAAKAAGRLDEALTRQKLLHSAVPYFEGLPQPAATAKTDADGRFQLNIPDEGDYVLVASSTRVVFNTVEKYFWIVRVRAGDSKVTLSNDNLTTSASADSVVTTKY
jgi:hypothetical protein